MDYAAVLALARRGQEHLRRSVIVSYGRAAIQESIAGPVGRGINLSLGEGCGRWGSSPSVPWLGTGNSARLHGGVFLKNHGTNENAGMMAVSGVRGVITLVAR